MGGLKLPLVGSFRPAGLTYSAEDPTEELWRRVAQAGTRNFWSNTIPDHPDRWEENLAWALPRLRQAVEFRRAALGLSLLARPLPLYYALYNLLGGLFAIRIEETPQSHHGLTIRQGASILDAGAVPREGFFTQFLEARGVRWNGIPATTLRECLQYIPELLDSLAPSDYPTVGAMPVTVKAYISGDLELRFRPSWFPEGASPQSEIASGSLRVPGRFKTTGDPYVYETKLEKGESDDKRIGLVLSDFAWPPLQGDPGPVWYIPRSKGGYDLPREAFYFIGLFILGSAVRYFPERLDEVSHGSSEIGWRLDRFLGLVERFLPQLALGWGFGHPVYVGGV